MRYNGSIIIMLAHRRQLTVREMNRIYWQIIDEIPISVNCMIGISDIVTIEEISMLTRNSFNTAEMVFVYSDGVAGSQKYYALQCNVMLVKTALLKISNQLSL